MKIKQGGFFDKYIIEFWDKYPEGLCAFFWKVVFTILAQIGVVMMLTVLAIAALGTATYPIWVWFASWSYPPLMVPVASALLWCFTAYAYLTTYREYLYETGQLEPPKPKPPKEPNIVVQYMTAAHHKVCPRMEYPHEQR